MGKIFQNSDWTDAIIEVVKNHYFLESDAEEDVRAAARRAVDSSPPDIEGIIHEVERVYYLTRGLEEDITKAYLENAPSK